ncbi:MAG: J domain-containing protein [Lachnospiraceae bacterium]|nr:J domain-containing protein [Lachnospiraceae bacterium]
MDACRILGVSGDCSTEEVKKRYRQLLHLVHPDAEAFRRRSMNAADSIQNQIRELNKDSEVYPYDILEITAAYTLLMGGAENDTGQESGAEASPHHARSTDPDDWIRRNPEYARAVWNAEENPNAFCEREILQLIEDFDGNVLGDFTLIRGKYLWQPEEEFPLFMKSIARAVELLIQHTEEEAEQQIYGAAGNPRMDDGYCSSEEQRSLLKKTCREKLTYLLAQQFIDAVHTLDQLVHTQRIKDGRETIYYIPAMLETSTSGPGKFCPELLPGETLLPDRVEQHRLFVKNQNGQQVGYLSYPDDRMYYLLIPLFEQKRVQVKIRVYKQKREGEEAGTGRKRAVQKHVRISLWLKFKESSAGMPEDISAQIQEGLTAYRNQFLGSFSGS